MLDDINDNARVEVKSAPIFIRVNAFSRYLKWDNLRYLVQEIAISH